MSSSRSHAGFLIDASPESWRAVLASSHNAGGLLRTASVKATSADGDEDPDDEKPGDKDGGESNQPPIRNL